LERLEKDSGLDARIRLVLSAAYYKIGMIQGDPHGPSLEDFAGAGSSFQKAEALLAPLYAHQSGDPDVLLRWIQIESGLAETTFRSGRGRAAIEAYSKLLPAAHRLGQLRPSDVTSAKQEAAIHERLANVLHTFDSSEGLDHANQQIALMRGLLGRFPGDAGLKRELGAGLSAAAGSLIGAGEPNKAALYYEQSIQMREELLQQDPHNVAIRRNLLVAYGNYASLLGIPWSPNLGRYAEARAYCDKAVAIAREMVKADPQDATARSDLAISLARLGMVEPNSGAGAGPGSATESLANLEEAIHMLEPIMKANPKSATLAAQLTLAREFAGHRLESLGRIAEAAKQYRQSLAETEAVSDAGNHPLAIQAFANEEALALLYASTGDRTTALEFADRAVSGAEALWGKAPTSEIRAGHLARAYFVDASVQRTFGDWDQARTAAERAVALWRPIQNRGVLAVHRGAIQDAEEILRQAVARRTQLMR
jgi:non-specific serine/threonine protein kinase/serine/threonine-protein kinase